MNTGLPFEVYAVVFFLVGIICMVMGFRPKKSLDGESADALVFLLVLTGFWSLIQIGFIINIPETVQNGLYTLSGIIGLIGVVTWLYFCSAYTGRNYHRNKKVQLFAVGVTVLIILLRVTNRYHGQYYVTEQLQEPFTYLATYPQPMYWVVIFISHIAAYLGIYFLFSMFYESEYATGKLTLLVIASGIPLLLSVTAITTDLLLPINYEPIGIAVFAVAILYIVEKTNREVEYTGLQQVFDAFEYPIMITDPDGNIVDHNKCATKICSELVQRGENIGELVPNLEIDRESEPQLFSCELDTERGEEREFIINRYEVRTGVQEVGFGFVFKDITTEQTQRRELKRHNDQWNELTGAIAHELRNSHNIVNGRINQSAQYIDNDIEQNKAMESLYTASEAAERMAIIIDELYKIAKFGQSIQEVILVNFETLVRDAYDRAGVSKNEDFDIVIDVEEGKTIECDVHRTEQLFLNVFKFARYNDADVVRISFEENEITISDDGKYKSADYGADLFEYEQSVPTSEAGMSLPMVRTLANVQGWGVAVDDEYEEGVKYCIENIGNSQSIILDGQRYGGG